MFIEDYGFSYKRAWREAQKFESIEELENPFIGYARFRIFKHGKLRVVSYNGEVTVYNQEGNRVLFKHYRGRNYYCKMRDVLRKIAKDGYLELSSN